MALTVDIAVGGAAGGPDDAHHGEGCAGRWLPVVTGAAVIDDGFLPPEDCAAQMGVTVERVVELVRRGVLRADREGFVQPAIVSGAIE